MPAETEAIASALRVPSRPITERFVDWAVNSAGPSTSSALIRIGIALLLWGRWAGEVLLYKNAGIAGLLLSVNFFAATLMLFVGYHSRIAAAWSGVVGLMMFYYFGHELGREPWTHHHTYLLSVSALFIALTPCGRSYSLDRYLAVRRAERLGTAPPAEYGNLWGLRLIAIQLSILYFFSALDKTNVAFLSGARLEHLYLWFYSGSDYPTWPGFGLLAMLAAIAVVVIEYGLAFGLPFRATRRYLVVPGLAFHGLLYVSLPVFTFSATMALLYLAYFDAEAIDRVVARLHGAGSSGRNSA